MSIHSLHSSYREKLVEHLFIGELLKCSWLDESFSVEISKPEVDRRGYDLILEKDSVIRHVQLKASHVGASTSSQKVHIALSNKASGCVIWIYFNGETAELGPFYYFGSAAGEPLPSLKSMKVAKHVKGNRDGVKAERPDIRVVNKGAFQKFDSIQDLYHFIFS
jgi:hypothetical protein